VKKTGKHPAWSVINRLRRGLVSQRELAKCAPVRMNVLADGIEGLDSLESWLAVCGQRGSLKRAAKKWPAGLPAAVITYAREGDSGEDSKKQ
jgi:hypothetical protein